MEYFHYGLRLFGELIQFARKKKIYWLIPLLLILLPAVLLIVTTQTATPLIYTLF